MHQTRAPSQKAKAVVTWLVKLRDDPQNGNAVMAIFRRGLSENAADQEQMMRYLHRYLSDDYRAQESGIFLIASLFALAKHAPTDDEGDMGDHYAQTRTKSASDEATEKRFSAILRAHQEDLPIYLRRAITYLKSCDIGINWALLLDDVWAWGHPVKGEYVRRRWARNFWMQKQIASNPNSDELIQDDSNDESTED